MASYNKVFLMGNLTRDPQVKHLPSQMVVAEFGLAVNRRYKTAAGEDKEEVAFVDCSAFGRQAETISQYCTKGKPIFVEGRLKYDTWEDKQGGGKRSKHSVVVDTFQFLGGRDGGGQGGGGGGGGSYDAEHGGGGHDETSQVRRPMPPRGPTPNRGGGPAAGNAPRPQQQPAQEPPFSEDQQFRDDDIPF
jgi:single-strand DNA-binding protein